VFTGEMKVIEAIHNTFVAREGIDYDGVISKHREHLIQYALHGN